jgi:hypothetical protein
MKRILILLSILVISVTTAMAQVGVFNHLAIGAGVGTQGISVDVATTLTKYAAVRAGVNFMPGIKVSDKMRGDIVEGGLIVPASFDVEGKFSRTTIDVAIDAYPFGNGFFVTAGLSFGGKKVGKLTGTLSDNIATGDGDLEIGEYKIPVKNGKVDGAIEVKALRPYFGLGYGRAVPKGRVACRIELGVQLHGKPVPTSAFGDVSKLLNDKDDDDFSKIVNKLTVYPVLKFRIAGRIL